MKRKLLYCGLGLFALLLFPFRPVFVSEITCDCVSGVVTEVSEGGVKDLVIKLSDREGFFYVNRGLERQFDLNKMTKKLIGQHVTISYVARHFSLLDLFDAAGGHIAELALNGEVIYYESPGFR